MATSPNLSDSPSNESAGSCPRCWAGKHKCERRPFKGQKGDCCWNCHVPRGLGNRAADLASNFPSTDIEDLLCKENTPARLQSLDTNPHTSSSHVLDFFFRRYSPNTKDRTSPKECLNFHGPFTYSNSDLIAKLDDIVLKLFSVKLDDSNPESRLIYYATLAGGYLHLLGSTKFLFAQVRTSLDPSHDEFEPESYNLDSHLKCILFLRVGDLITEIMRHVRPGSIFGAQPSASASAYSAAGILNCEVKHATSGLRTCAFSEYMLGSKPSTTQGPFLRWLTEIESELKGALGEDCGTYPSWRQEFDGPTNQLFRSPEEITIVAYLSHTKIGLKRSNESPTPPRPPPSGGPHSPASSMPRLASRRSSTRSTNSNFQSHIMPKTTGVNMPFSTPANLQLSHPTNQDANHVMSSLGTLPASYPTHQRPRTVPHGASILSARKLQLRANNVSNDNGFGALQCQQNPIHTSIFQDPDVTQATIFSDNIFYTNPFQSSQTVQTGINDDYTLSFVLSGESVEDDTFPDFSYTI